MSKKTSPQKRARRRVTSLEDVRIFQVTLRRDVATPGVAIGKAGVSRLTSVVAFGKNWHGARDAAMVLLGCGPGEIMLKCVRRKEDVVSPKRHLATAFAWKNTNGAVYAKHASFPLAPGSWHRVEQTIRAIKRTGGT
jgi:hypothetical protein